MTGDVEQTRLNLLQAALLSEFPRPDNADQVFRLHYVYYNARELPSQSDESEAYRQVVLLIEV